jgi:hypothetical protein
MPGIEVARRPTRLQKHRSPPQPSRHPVPPRRLRKHTTTSWQHSSSVSCVCRVCVVSCHVCVPCAPQSPSVRCHSPRPTFVSFPKTRMYVLPSALVPCAGALMISCARLTLVCVCVCGACLVRRVLPRTSQDLNIVLYQYSYQPSSAQVRSYLVTASPITPSVFVLFICFFYKKCSFAYLLIYLFFFSGLVVGVACRTCASSSTRRSK